MSRMIDQIRASKLPSNMMQFAARGALQVPPAENIEILVYLARYNKVFGDTARMTLAGWDEKSCIASIADPQTPAEVLNYFVSSDNVRPRLLATLLENPSVSEAHLVKLATSAMRDTIEIMLKSSRVQTLQGVLNALMANPYLKKEEAEALRAATSEIPGSPSVENPENPLAAVSSTANTADDLPPDPEDEEAVAAYLKKHADDIAAEGEKPFQAIGGVFDLLGEDYFPVTQTADAPEPAQPAVAAKPAVPAKPQVAVRENSVQKVNRLDVKGRIQLALKGNKEERSLLIRDGTKVVALAVLEAPKLSDGEVEKFASQKNVLQAVLRQIPLKRRFMKNYIVVRNLCANPRTPLDLGLGLMKNLLIADLKNLGNNKDVPETIRKLALKMYKQKLDAANKK